MMAERQRKWKRRVELKVIEEEETDVESIRGGTSDQLTGGRGHV